MGHVKKAFNIKESEQNNHIEKKKALWRKWTVINSPREKKDDTVPMKQE